MKRGQVSIEFMFLILITIVYLTTVAMPTLSASQNTTIDTENVARANIETQKIYNAATAVSLLGTGSRQTITSFIPDNTTITCTDTNISFTTTLTQKPFPAQCDLITGTCTKTFRYGTGITFTCIPSTLSGPLKTEIIIEKKTTTTVDLNIAG